MFHFEVTRPLEPVFRFDTYYNYYSFANLKMIGWPFYDVTLLLFILIKNRNVMIYLTCHFNKCYDRRWVGLKKVFQWSKVLFIYSSLLKQYHKLMFFMNTFISTNYDKLLVFLIKSIILFASKIYTETYSEPSRTSKMEIFAKIVNGWKMELFSLF